MVQPADLRQLSDLALLGCLHPTMMGRVHVKRPVDSPDMIIVDIGLENTAKMNLMQHDDIVEALVPDAANDPFRIRILPWTSRCDFDLFNTSTVSLGRLEWSFMYVQWGQALTLFPVIETSQLIALQALLARLENMRRRTALKRLVQDHRDALANLR